MAKRKLFLTFHGRVLEHLGIQIYQSPINAVAELVANSWDADAEKVHIRLPSALNENAELVVEDDGVGMTFKQCQDRYLNVGWNRRGTDPDKRSPGKDRPILGRKGIGKFAGFGIAKVMTIETISEENGEQTVFQLDLEKLVSDEYASTEAKEIPVSKQEPPSESRRKKHGTIIRLSNLTFKRTPSLGIFRRGFARRFTLHQQVADFEVQVNGKPIPESFDLAKVEFVFPRDYEEGDEVPPLEVVDEKTVDDAGWGREFLGSGRRIRWRFLFYEDTIADEGLRGIAVLARGKLCQSPFLFNLTGGLQGQHGVQYLAGQVEADYLDELPDDIIATERQRVDWKHEEADPLLQWGQDRVKDLLKIWGRRRAKEKVRRLDEKISGFSSRLEKLGRREKRTVERALRRVAEIQTLTNQQFDELGDGILTAWEQGRLRDLIAVISEEEAPSEERLLSILAEAQVLTALSAAEAVKTKLLTVGGLKVRIEKGELERAVRDYVADNPWLVSPRFETFRKERTVRKLLMDASIEAGMVGGDWEGRVDLALSSGSHLAIVEFMRPGVNLDWEHLDRFERYVTIVRTNVEANTAGPFNLVTGYIVADGLEKNATNLRRIERIKADLMWALDWEMLFSQALSQWQEFLEILAGRSPEDERLQALL